MKHFASDNYAGVHPTIMQALNEANVGHESAYGGDRYTEELDAVNLAKQRAALAYLMALAQMSWGYKA
ncbi:beta-eliminating lyase-related protein [Moraxella porci]|uniref:beta-eliminating lyase-related protein n=1 Tax=Moraxella porci TaxID=1288392 RepID=UPI0024469818|nr:beta-eliminating lyase-related protein [Moraxella porci]MDH2274416.1 beta-eliminating lyase-related protein [Moraxella porci]